MTETKRPEERPSALEILDASLDAFDHFYAPDFESRAKVLTKYLTTFIVDIAKRNAQGVGNGEDDDSIEGDARQARLSALTNQLRGFLNDNSGLIRAIYVQQTNLGRSGGAMAVAGVAEFARQRPNLIGIGVGLLVEQLLEREKRRIETARAVAASRRASTTKLVNREVDQKDVEKIEFAVRNLKSAVTDSNEITEEDREFALIEIAYVELALTQPRISVALIEHFNNAVLQYLIKKFPDAVIGLAVRQLITVISGSVFHII